MDNFEALKAATLGAQQLEAPGGNPLGASNASEIAGLYRSSFQLPQSGMATRAQGFNTGVTVANNKAAQEEEIARLKESAQKLADKVDPSKYQRIKQPGSGYTFLDPDGKEISAYEYASILGTKPADVLADSENAIDIGYIEDAKNLSDYAKAKLNAKYNNDDALKAQEIEEQVKKAWGVDLNKMNLDEVKKMFQEAYPTVYGLTNKGVPIGNTVLPGNVKGTRLSGGDAIGE